MKSTTDTLRHWQVLSRLARETGALLGELGVRPEDSGWIAEHAGTVASLVRPWRARGHRSRLGELLRRTVRRRV